jgi:hypothetical protein
VLLHGTGGYETASDATLVRFDAALNVLGSTTLDLAFQDTPWAVAVDPRGRLLVAEGTYRECGAGDPNCMPPFYTEPVYTGLHVLRLGPWGVAGCLAQGVCVDLALSDCDDGDPCTKDGCDPASGCTHEAWPDGTPCGDGVTCSAGLCL